MHTKVVKLVNLYGDDEKLTRRFPKMEDAIIDEVAMDISSTEIRQKVHEGEEFSSLVLPQIAEYIRENGLYI